MSKKKKINSLIGVAPGSFCIFKGYSLDLGSQFRIVCFLIEFPSVYFEMVLCRRVGGRVEFLWCWVCPGG